MAFYLREQRNGPVLSTRRPSINEFFLSSYTLSVYNGCELACPYCDGWAFSERPLNETVVAPVDLPQRLADELEYVDRGEMVAITALSDPYQPAEQNFRLTRQALQVLAERGQPTIVLTKSPEVLQDLSLLQRIHERSLAVVMTTLLTVDAHLAAKLEGKTIAPAARLAMLRSLKQAGIPVGVALMPIMPYVNDTESALRATLRACAEAEVDFVVWEYLHIPNERHRHRIDELMGRIASYPSRYLRDIYQGRQTVSSTYRRERDEMLITRCDGLSLDIRAPHRLFAGRLRPRNEVALLLRHAAFRDRAMGRDHVAELHRELAERCYRGEASASELQRSPLWNTLKPIAERF